MTRAELRDEIQAALASFAEDVMRRELEQLGEALRQDLRSVLEQLGADESVAELLTKSSMHKAPACHTSQASTTLQRGASAGSTGSTESTQSTEGTGRAGSLWLTSPPCSPLWLPLGIPDTSLLPYDLLPPSLPQTPSSSRHKDWRRSFVEKATKANRKVEFLPGSQCRETHDINDVLEEANKALDDGIEPHLVEDGLGGTYFVRDRHGRSIAVFKPRDEEPLGPNNPKVHAGEGKGSGLKEGVLVGEAAINEFVAFLLDHASSPELRAGVCPTALVCMANSVFHSATEDRHSLFHTIKDKVGSFQLFAQHDCTSEDLGPSRFPVDQVHRLAALDIRLYNTDRHSGNILVREQGGKVSALVPIDHGYALPGEMSAEVTLEWLSWPASKQPFSEVMRREILAIDVGAVEAALKRRVPLLRAECLRTLRTCTRLLQYGVEVGLTAFDIGSLMTRPWSLAEKGPQPPSALEEAVTEAARRATDSGLTQDELLDKLLREKCQSVAARSQGPG